MLSDVCVSLLEQALGHLIEAAAPGEELVGRALGDETLGVVACSLQVSDALVDAVGILLVTTTLEDILHHLRILDLIGSILAAREQTPVAEHLGTAQGDEFRLHTTHRETSQSTVPLVGLGEELLVNDGHEFVDEQFLELLGGELADGAELEVVGQAIGHDDDEGP